MIESLNFFSILLFFNSLGTVVLIFNQNDSTKDSIVSQNSSSGRNPLEKITWILVVFQLILLLIKIKMDPF